MSKQLVGVINTERRISPRYAVDLSVLFVIEGLVVQARCEDVSMTGMRLVSDVDLEGETQIEAHFSLEGGMSTHKLTGRIVWSRAAADDSATYLHGFQFDALSPETRLELSSLIESVGGDTQEDIPLLADDAVLEVEAEPDPAPPPAHVAAPTPQSAPEATSGASADPSAAPVSPEAPPPVDDESAAVERLSSLSSPLTSPATGQTTSEPPSAVGAENSWQVAQHLQRAIADDVKQREANQGLAEKLRQKALQARRSGNIDAAIDGLQKACELVPDSDSLCEELAELVYLKGDARESARLFDRALRLRIERKG